MRFSGSRFLVVLVVTVIAAFVALAALRAFGVLTRAPAADDPAELARSAAKNLEAVRLRQPGERRPASYDSVLAPLDGLLKLAREAMQSPDYNPQTGLEKIRSLAAPVIDIAARADQLAKSETGYLVKDYRFGDQKSEACRYLAAAMWERVQANVLSRQQGAFSDAPDYPPGEMSEMKRIIADGLTANPENRDLFYLRCLINRAEGLFAAAAKDIGRSVELDRNFAEGWNTLGLVRISLKDFPGAEEALERARTLALEFAEQAQIQPGPEYASIVYNLATFHDGLASYYTREHRIDPTVESERLSSRHASEAKRYFAEFLAREPSGTPDAQAARARLAALP